LAVLLAPVIAPSGVSRPESTGFRVTSINSYVVNGNTRWVIGIRTNSTTTVQVLAKAETVTTTEQVKIATITVGAKITVLVDTSQPPPIVLSVQ
jgi:hypothetical protein